MNKLCFTAVVLNLNNFLTADFNKQILHKNEVSIDDFIGKCG